MGYTVNIWGTLFRTHNQRHHFIASLPELSG